MGHRAQAHHLWWLAQRLVVGDDARPEAVAHEHHALEADLPGQVHRAGKVVGGAVEQAAAVHHSKVGHARVDRQRRVPVMSELEGQAPGNPAHVVAERPVHHDHQGARLGQGVVTRAHEQAIPMLVVRSTDHDELGIRIQIIVPKLRVGTCARAHGDGVRAYVVGWRAEVGHGRIIAAAQVPRPRLRGCARPLGERLHTGLRCGGSPGQWRAQYVMGHRPADGGVGTVPTRTACADGIYFGTHSACMPPIGEGWDASALVGEVGVQSRP